MAPKQATPGDQGATSRRLLRTAADVMRAAWLRFALVVLLLGLASLVLAGVAVSLLSELVYFQRDLLVERGELTRSGVTLLLVEVGAPLLVVMLVAVTVVLASLTAMADDRLDGRSPAIGRALARGLRRAPAVFVAGAMALVGITAVVVATPILVLVGVGGLLITPLVRLGARRWPRWQRWPAPRRLVVLAVPFGAAVVVAVRWGLVLPAAALERNSPRRALRRSRDLVRGRTAVVALALVGGFGLYWVVQLACTVLERTALPVGVVVAVRLLSQVLLAALPIVVVTVIFRHLAGPSDPDLAVVAPTPARPPHLTATVVLVVVAVFASSTFIMGARAPRPAAAATLAAFTVDSLGDEGDAVAGDGACATTSGSCTLRAAVEEANATDAETSITVEVDGRIVVTSPLTVTAPLAIDGTGHRVTVTGRSCETCAPASQLMRFTTPGVDYSITDLTLDGGLGGPEGGGAVESVGRGELVRVTLTGNQSASAPGGAVVVLGGDLWVVNATFVDNVAPEGADLANRGGAVSIDQSTFVGAPISSLSHHDDAVYTNLYTSIVATQSAPACAGPVRGGYNLASDDSCDSRGAVGALGAFGDHGGWVDTVALPAGSPAVDRGNPEGCPATDARGVTRPQGTRCDIGAFELEVAPPPHPVIDDLGDEGDAVVGDGICATTTGACTLRAAVEEVNAYDGLRPTITVGVDGTIRVHSPLELTREVTITGIDHRATVSGGSENELFVVPGGVDVTLEQLTLADGATSDPAGGAAVRSSGTLSLDAVTLTGHRATAGPGGAIASDGRVVITNATFSGNAASGGGSDIWSTGTGLVEFSTFVGATNGSIWDQPGNDLGVFKSIITSATGPSCTGVTWGWSTLSDGTCAGLLSTDTSGLGELGWWGGSVPTVSLLPGSAALDRIAGYDCPATDARGVTRPQPVEDGLCDLGAYELEIVKEPTTATVTASADTSVVGERVTFTAAVAAVDAAAGVPIGVVEFRADDTLIGTETLDVAGTATFDTAELAVGPHAITVAYLGDRTYAGAVSPLVVHEVRAPGSTVDLAISDEQVVVGQPVTFTATVTAVDPAVIPTGAVTFSAGTTTIGSAPLDATGTAVLVAPLGTVGDHAVTAFYAGDGAVGAGVSSVRAIHVDPAATEAILEVDGESTVGDQVVATVRVAAIAPGGGVPAGTVTIGEFGVWVATAELGPDGSVPVPLDGLTVGVHYFQVSYDGSEAYGASSSVTVVHLVAPMATTTALTTSANPAVFGSPATLTATVTSADGSPVGGAVSFWVGDQVTQVAVDPVTGTATLSADRAAGTYDVHAYYDGDPTHGYSPSGPISLVILPAASATVLATPDPAVATWGQPVTLRATVAVAGSVTVPVGSVTFRDGAQVVGVAPVDEHGVATLVTTALDIGDRSLTASFAGASLLDSTSASLAYRVEPARTTIALSTDQPRSVFGESVTFTATVSPIGSGPVPTGTVVFTEGAVELARVPVGVDGTASLSTTSLSVGAHTLAAAFQAAATHNDSSTELAHAVDRAATALTVTSDVVSAVSGQRVTYTAHLAVVAPGATTPTGTVTFEGSTSVTAALQADGTATVTLPAHLAPSGGWYPVVVTYSGDGRAMGSIGSMLQRTDPASLSIALTVSPALLTLGESVSVRAVIAPAGPGGVPEWGYVTLRSRGVVVTQLPIGAGGVVEADLPTPLLLGVGAHSLSVDLAAGGGFNSAVSPATSVTVGPARPDISLRGTPNPSVAGHAVAFDVRVVTSVDVPPLGTIDLFHGATKLGSAPVAWQGDGWGARITTDVLELGDQVVQAFFQPSTMHFATATSPPVTQVVEPIPTETAIAVPSVTMPGERATWQVYVRNVDSGLSVRPRPTGSVAFTVDGIALGSAVLTAGPQSGWSTATITSGPLGAGVHPVQATYVPTGSFAGSSGSIDQFVGVIAPKVLLDLSTTTTRWGEWVLATARVEPQDPTKSGVPTGDITIDGGTTSCTVPAAGGTCVLTWDRPGYPRVTASYAGDTSFGPGASSPLIVEVGKRRTDIRVELSEVRPVTGEPFTIDWRVDGPGAGPSDGSVSVQVGSTRCASTLTGTCTTAFDLRHAGNGQWIEVRFGGDSWWESAVWSQPVTPVGCYPLDLEVYPVGAGTLTTAQVPNCGGGTGYLEGTLVTVTAAPAPAPGPSFDWKLAKMAPSGRRDLVQTIVIGNKGQATSHVQAQFEQVWHCITVRLGVENTSGTPAYFESPTRPDCPIDEAGSYLPPAWTDNGSYRVARFLVGSTVETTTTSYGDTDRYGFRWAGGDRLVTQEAPGTFVATRDVTVTALFGPRCYQLSATATGAGTVAIDSPANCRDPRQPAAGWTDGSKVKLSAASTGTAFLDRWDGPGTAAAPRWDGVGPEQTNRFAYRYEVTVDRPTDPIVVQAHFDECRRLDVEPQVVMGHGTTVESRASEVERSVAANCPNRQGDSWYRPGTQLSLVAKPGSNRAFGKWNLGPDWPTVYYDRWDGLGVDTSQPIAPDLVDTMDYLSVTMDRDVRLRPSFYNPGGDCPQVRVFTEQPEWLQVQVTEGLDGDLVCRHGTLADGPATTLSGTVRSGRFLGLTASSRQGNPMIGWQTDNGNAWATEPDQSIRPYVSGGLLANAIACQSIDKVLRLTDITGQVHDGPVTEDDFIATFPEPNCPYSDRAWLVGTTVEVSALAPPEGYRFLGWDGAAAGTRYLTTVHLNGLAPSLPVVGAYEVVCHTLTLTHDAKDVTTYPEPNCPGAAPTDFKYVGGTFVGLFGKVPHDKVWQGWVGDVVAKGKVNPAFVTMDADKSAGHRWRSKDLNEKTLDGLEWFGDQLAVAGKKVVGAAALALGEVLNGAPPFSVLGALSAVLGGVGSLLDLIGVDADITYVIKQVGEYIALASMPFTCAGAWGMSSSTSKATTVIPDEVGLGGEFVGGVTAVDGGIGSLQDMAAARSRVSSIQAASRDSLRALDAAQEPANAAAQVSAARMAKLSDVGGAGLGMGLAMLSIAMDGPGFGWDSSAKDAWTNGDSFFECAENSFPDSMGLPPAEEYTYGH